MTQDNTPAEKPSETVAETTATPAEEKPENMMGTINAVGSQLQAIEQFVARRFDEISMEINATSQQVDMAEEGITQRFVEVLEVLSAISYSGGGNSPANAGVELDAVVDMTEDAANRILDASGRISAIIGASINWANEESRQKVFDSINNDVAEIYMACSFQDITGQRIRQTLENLKTIEDRLSSTLERLGIKIPQQQAGENVAKAASQGDVDALFAAQNAAENADAAPAEATSQDDVDALFSGDDKDS